MLLVALATSSCINNGDINVETNITIVGEGSQCGGNNRCADGLACIDGTCVERRDGDDAGTEPTDDAGESLAEDAGSSVLDGGAEIDAGVADAGDARDAGVEDDGGVEIDSGLPVADAGYDVPDASADAGTESDSGIATSDAGQGATDAGPDAGNAVDAGVWDAGADCNPSTDADFDGANECADCDDHDGTRKPQAQGGTERCNGADDDCDLLIDEDFDDDGDGYTTCGTNPAGGLNPARIDCEDDAPAINPGACELCLLAGQVVCGTTNNDDGNGVDEDCDGYVDELCAPCSAADPDGDGVSECAGDCAPGDINVHPGRAEACDGKDNDCNTATTENCSVGDACNFAGGADGCVQGLLCVEGLAAGGNPSGVFSCQGLCNGAPVDGGVAVVGDTCDPTETCSNSLGGANLHTCRVTVDVGSKAVGEACTADDQCRSGACMNFGGGERYCVDACASDAYCPTSMTCQAQVGGPARCLLLGASQTLLPGEACGDLPATCRNGPASCVDWGGTQGERCSSPCCASADCAQGEYCSLNGPTDMSAVDGVDTVPMCVPQSNGNGQRQAGAACASNAHCASEFCDVQLGVCIELCCSDASCSDGNSCHLTEVTLPTGEATFARACLALTPSGPIEAR